MSASALAVIADEIQQEPGDLAILLNSGLAKAGAFAYDLIFSLSTLSGVLVGWFWLDEATRASPSVFAAGVRIEHRLPRSMEAYQSSLKVEVLSGVADVV